MRTAGVLALLASAVVPLHGTAQATLAERFQTTLDSLWSAAQSTDEIFPGATAAYITPEGEVFAFATGYSDVEGRIRMAADMRMPSGSIGKTYVAATAISMWLDGTLDLDDPISKWIGDAPWFDRLPNGPDITLRHLLTHSGGLIDHAFDSEEFHADVRALVASGDRDATLSHERLVSYALDREPLFPAGLGYNYTDTGYIVAGLVLEAASGRTYDDELRRRILDPLGLGMTHPQNGRGAPRLAQGYAAVSAEIFGTPLEVVGDDGRMVFNPAIEWTGGGLYNNPQSLVRWAKLLYEGEAFEGDYLGDLLESAVRGASPVPGSVYSLGVTITQTPRGITYGHSGFFPGYNSYLVYFPEAGAALALQINTDASRGGDHIRTLSNVLLDGLATRE
ncbi:MAG: serine hydrolase domain-containing protein [Gemmatimonadota bacterium]|nr:serine hydrolase domain-containing protein [Gemmatimonadota bacterium]